MEDINKNLTPDQTAGIKAQDVTNQNVIDVDVLESKQEGIPEAAEPNNAGTAVQSLAQTALDARAEEKAQAEVARQEAITLQKEVSDREGTISALSGEVLGQGQAQTAAIEDAGLNKKQAEIDETDRNIQALTTKIAKQEIQDNLQVSQLAGRGLGIPAGIVRGQQSLLSGQLKAKRDSDSADLANLIASSALFQGKVDNAKLALKEQIELEFGDKERELELEIGFLERTDAKLANVKEKELEEIQRQKDEAITVFDIQTQAAQAGASQAELQAIGNAKTEAEALVAAKSLGRSAKMALSLQSAQLSKIKSDMARATRADANANKSSIDNSGKQILSKEQASKFNTELFKTDNYKAVTGVSVDAINAMTEYRRVLEKHGGSDVSLLPNSAKNELDTAFTNLKLFAKDFHALGVIAGPDEELLDSSLGGRPTGYSINPNAKYIRKKSIDNALTLFEQSVSNRVNANVEAIEGAYGNISDENLPALKTIRTQSDTINNLIFKTPEEFANSYQETLPDNEFFSN